MSKPLEINRVLSKLFRNEKEEYLKARIRQTKPAVDSKCPESFYYLQNRFSKTQKNNWNSRKINEDTNAPKKIIFNSRPKNDRKKYKPLFKYEHDFLSFTRKEELINMAMENLNIYNRLNSKKGNYNLKNYLRDYERAQYYKKNHCKFPSIDFYRTSKTNKENLCSIFNYCTFYNYKTINEKFMNEYLKKTNSQMMHKTKSANELFNINKYKKSKIYKYKLSSFKSKNNNEEQKLTEKNQNNDYVNRLRNKIFKPIEITNKLKTWDEKNRNFSENTIKNNNIINEEEDNYNNNEEEENNNIAQINNDKNDKNDEEFVDVDNFDKNKENHFDKEEISENIDEEENLKEKYKQFIEENKKIKEEDEIEDSIDNEKNKIKQRINDNKKEQNNNNNNNMDDEDKFIDVLNDV